jgi:hypothetical protein
MLTVILQLQTVPYVEAMVDLTYRIPTSASAELVAIHNGKGYGNGRNSVDLIKYILKYPVRINAMLQSQSMLRSEWSSLKEFTHAHRLQWEIIAFSYHLQTASLFTTTPGLK